MRFRNIIRRRPSAPTIMSFAALVLATSGLALAATGGAGPIHGCYQKHGGALRVAAKCSSAEKPLSWNRRGPAGASAGFATTDPVYHFAASASEQPVARLNLPPGNYLLFATINGVNLNGSTDTAFNCFLRAGKAVDEMDTDLMQSVGNSAFSQSLALSLPHAFPAAGAAKLSCETSGVSDMEARNARISAIQVQKLH